LRKVDIIANIGERAHSRQLKTNTSWWEMRGGRFRNVVDWIADNKAIILVLTLISLAIAIWGIKK
jgi:hypothetical protein